LGLLTRNTKPVADYQQWVTGDITNGDILDVYGALGNRCAHSVTIESLGGPTTIRFNVAKKVYKEHSQFHNQWLNQGQGMAKPAPILIDEIKETKPDIVIEADEVQTWYSTEIAVVDIEVVTKSADLKITVT
jgi:hypothetical protein